MKTTNQLRVLPHLLVEEAKTRGVEEQPNLLSMREKIMLVDLRIGTYQPIRIA